MKLLLFCRYCTRFKRYYPSLWQVFKKNITFTVIRIFSPLQGVSRIKDEYSSLNAE
jgi:hypothetical protein